MQEGFGWTNGVVLDFLSKYGDVIRSDDDITITHQEKHADTGVTLTFLLFTSIFIIGFLFYILKKKRYHYILLPRVALSRFINYIRLRNR